MFVWDDQSSHGLLRAHVELDPAFGRMYLFIGLV